MARSRYLFSEKNPVDNARLDSKSASRSNRQIPPFFHNRGILIYLLTMNVLASQIVKSFISLISLLSTL